MASPPPLPRLDPPKSPPARIQSPPVRPAQQSGASRFPPPRETAANKLPPPLPPPRDSQVKVPPPLPRSESSARLRDGGNSPVQSLSPTGETKSPSSPSHSARFPPTQMPRPVPPPRSSVKQLNTVPPLPTSPIPADVPARAKPRGVTLSARKDADLSWADTWTTLVGPVDLLELESNYRMQFRERVLKLQKLVVEKGFPESQRPDLWGLFCGAGAERAANPDHFYEKCAAIDQSATKTAQVIARDVARTMQNHPFFQSSQGMACLSRILNVFSFKCPHIGYCQSMNDIAAALVLVYQADECRVFWVLERIINSVMPADYYTSNMIGVRADCEVFTQLVQQNLSKIYAHCSSNYVDFQIVVMPWFMCLYTKTLPLDSALRVWDVMMLEGGSCTLLRFALAILQKHESTILGLKDTGDLMQYLARLGADETDVTALLEMTVTLNNSSVPDKVILKLRENQRKVLEKEYLTKASFSTPTRFISQVVNPVALSGQKARLVSGEAKQTRTFNVVKNPRVVLDRATCEKCGEVAKVEDLCCSACGYKKKAQLGVVHAGWLKKKSKQHKHIWQNRYVELWTNWLTYFHSPQDAANNRNPFSVQMVDILALDIPDHGDGVKAGVRFNLILNRDMGRDTLEFQAPTKEQCTEWLNLLTAATKHKKMQTEVDHALMTPEPRLARETVGPSPSGQFHNLSPIRPRQKTEAMSLLWRSMVGIAIAPPSTPSVDQRLKENVSKGYDLVKSIGIPAEERANVWEIVTNARVMCASNPRAYSQAVAQLGNLDNKIVGDIRKDVRRTMQNHPFFQAQSGMDALTRVLSVFSIRNPHIGYCQSMNVLAGTLLVIYGLEHEERAYWMLDTLINNYLPPDYYTSSIIGARADCVVLSYLLQEYWPKLAAHLRTHNIDHLCLPDSAKITRCQNECKGNQTLPQEFRGRARELQDASEAQPRSTSETHSHSTAKEFVRRAFLK